MYEECPIYRKNLVTLRQTRMEDAKELLKCYSDEKAVPFFNSDNCHGDDFHYTTLERMKQAIEFWNISYQNKYFVRWTVIENNSKEKIGTVEMFHRIAEDDFNHYGILRIDLRSDYETQPILTEILEIVDHDFFQAFDVDGILTKAVPENAERIAALTKMGYQASDRKFMMKYNNYFIKHKKM
ncbi:MAG: GNAT family N-acetyltransferase [Lachnospiraceae bacterium]|nr:GNAT family N-acetyltransferase [Lachnospiraceae bacterium]